MHELTLRLTSAEKLSVDLAAAALGVTPAELIASELRYRFGMLTRASDVVALRKGVEEVTDGRD